MVEPTIVPRAAHTISRRDIDSGALKVLYQLHEHNYVAYLVGGSVRDLLLGRRPKDFDIGTSAHPHQVKKLFRNCWIIGRRFRLAHVKFGTKTIEVATFRRLVEASELTPEIEAAAFPSDDGAAPGNLAADSPTNGDRAAHHAERSRLIHRDNTYGTPEEDAFRRDFTVNALFYDIGTFAIIDYVGGLDDLERRLIRCIGDPSVRFIEDPVRMLRAVVLAARLQFTIDEPILDAIKVHRHEIARSAPARLMEEFYKILRSGHAEEAMRQLRATGLMKEITLGARRGARGGLAFDRRARSLSQPVRRGARVADQCDPGRDAAPSDGPDSPSALLRRRARAQGRARDAADRPAGRRAPAANHRHPAEARSTSKRRCARSGASCTAPSSTKRSPGSRSTAIGPMSWRTGASSRRRRDSPAAPAARRSITAAAADAPFRRRRRRRRRRGNYGARS